MTTKQKIQPAKAKTPQEYDETRIIERPDGFYWQSIRGPEEYGPFATVLEAVLDMQSGDLEAELEVGETVEEAEEEIGISGWTDPETGELAEDHKPRVEDH